MSLTLTIDSAAWRNHLDEFSAEVPGLVPVAKGNGYGFGLGRLAGESARLPADALAVGTAHEVPMVRSAGWEGDIVILNPVRPDDQAALALLAHPKIITTISRLEDIALVTKRAPQARVIMEIETSMQRHGIPASKLDQVDVADLRFEGWSMHLPSRGSLTEAQALAIKAVKHLPGEVWVSHLTVSDYRALRDELGGKARMRVGTRLWLGAPEALKVTGTVLDVHRVRHGQRLGYTQRKSPEDGLLIIVSGGTSHGVALAAPTTQRSLKQRLKTVAAALLEARGRTRSPFSIGGKKRDFIEPPHMHSSMLFISGTKTKVAVGDELPVTVRYTTTNFDEVRFR